jgi:hypothetical protein
MSNGSMIILEGKKQTVEEENNNVLFVNTILCNDVFGCLMDQRGLLFRC